MAINSKISLFVVCTSLFYGAVLTRANEDGCKYFEPAKWWQSNDGGIFETGIDDYKVVAHRWDEGAEEIVDMLVKQKQFPPDDDEFKKSYIRIVRQSTCEKVAELPVPPAAFLALADKLPGPHGGQAPFIMSFPPDRPWHIEYFYGDPQSSVTNVTTWRMVELLQDWTVKRYTDISFEWPPGPVYETNWNPSGTIIQMRPRFLTYASPDRTDIRVMTLQPREQGVYPSMQVGDDGFAFQESRRGEDGITFIRYLTLFDEKFRFSRSAVGVTPKADTIRFRPISHGDRANPQAVYHIGPNCINSAGVVQFPCSTYQTGSQELAGTVLPDSDRQPLAEITNVFRVDPQTGAWTSAPDLMPKKLTAVDIAANGNDWPKPATANAGTPQQTPSNNTPGSANRGDSQSPADTTQAAAERPEVSMSLGLLVLISLVAVIATALLLRRRKTTTASN